MFLEQDAALVLVRAKTPTNWSRTTSGTAGDPMVRRCSSRDTSGESLDGWRRRLSAVIGGSRPPSPDTPHVGER